MNGAQWPVFRYFYRKFENLEQNNFLFMRPGEVYKYVNVKQSELQSQVLTVLVLTVVTFHVSLEYNITVQLVSSFMCSHSIHFYKFNLMTLSEAQIISWLKIWRLIQNQLEKISK